VIGDGDRIELCFFYVPLESVQAVGEAIVAEGRDRMNVEIDLFQELPPGILPNRCGESDIAIRHMRRQCTT